MNKLLGAELTAAEWKLWTYLTRIESWGDKYVDIPDTLTIITQLKISKATYYRAIAKLQKLELFDFQDKGFTVRNLHGNSQVLKKRKESQKCEPSLKNETTDSLMRVGVSKARQDSQECKTQSLEPLPQKVSKASQTIQTSKTITDSLSFEERENFYKFCKRKSEELPEKIVLIDSWIRKHEEELVRLYHEAYPKGQSSAVAVAPKKLVELHEAIAAGLEDGRIKKLDPHYQGLWTDSGWMPQRDWLEMNT